MEYIPEIKRRRTSFIKKTNDSWRMDETYIKVKGEWVYLYRAVDIDGNTIDFYLSKRRDTKASKTFFEYALQKPFNKIPRVITTNKWKPTKVAISQMRILDNTEHRNLKFLNNIVESDHRRIKEITKQMLGFKTFQSASILIDGIEISALI